MSSYAREYVRITYEKQKENSLENITWSEMGKQNVQAKEVYYAQLFKSLLTVIHGKYQPRFEDCPPEKSL